jgi:hypothetical protein
MSLPAAASSRPKRSVAQVLYVENDTPQPRGKGKKPKLGESAQEEEEEEEVGVELVREEAAQHAHDGVFFSSSSSAWRWEKRVTERLLVRLPLPLLTLVLIAAFDLNGCSGSAGPPSHPRRPAGLEEACPARKCAPKKERRGRRSAAIPPPIIYSTTM